MAIKDPDIYRIIERIGDHYQKNVANRFVRKAFVVLEMAQSEWDKLDNLTTKNEYYRQQGFQFDELYEMVIAGAHFIHQAREKLLGNLKGMLAQGGSDQERVLRDMAAQTFPTNLAVLSDLVNELYMRTTALDRDAAKGKRPVYEKIPQLKELGKFLVNQ